MSDIAERLIVASVPTVLSLLLVWLVGLRLSDFWASRRKKRDLELAAAESFYACYGEFCAVWKEWNYLCSKMAMEGQAGFRERKTILLERACRAEGALEGVLLKIASEISLTQEEADELGNLRQAYQVLRERIQKNGKIPYAYSGDKNYAEFKRLATFVSSLLCRGSYRRPTRTQAAEMFIFITNNSHEEKWR